MRAKNGLQGHGDAEAKGRVIVGRGGGGDYSKFEIGNWKLEIGSGLSGTFAIYNGNA